MPHYVAPKRINDKELQPMTADRIYNNTVDVVVVEAVANNKQPRAILRYQSAELVLIPSQHYLGFDRPALVATNHKKLAALGISPVR